MHHVPGPLDCWDVAQPWNDHYRHCSSLMEPNRSQGDNGIREVERSVRFDRHPGVLPIQYKTPVEERAFPSSPDQDRPFLILIRTSTVRVQQQTHSRNTTILLLRPELQMAFEGSARPLKRQFDRMNADSSASGSPEKQGANKHEGGKRVS